MLEIKNASVNQKEIALNMLRESALWLRNIGSDQWQDVLRGEDRHGLDAAIEKGNVFFLCENENTIVGMVAIWTVPSEWDCYLWKGKSEESACYIHRLVVRPQYRKSNYGNRFLDLIKIKFKNKELRLDCLADNSKLVDFYQNNDFICHGQFEDDQGRLFDLFSYSRGKI